MNNKKILFADLGLILTAFVWGSGFVATKNALSNFSPTDIMIIRFGLATLISFVVFHKKALELSFNDIKAGGMIGVFLFLGFAFQTAGLQYTLAGKQAFLTGTNVIMVPWIYWLIKKDKPDTYNLVAAIMMFAGIAFLTLDFQNSMFLNKGDVLTLICAFFFACHILSIGFFSKFYDPIKLTIIQFATTFLMSALWRLSTGEQAFSMPTSYLTDVVFLGVFSTFLAFLLQNTAQKHTSSTHAAVLLSLESFFGSFMAILLLGDAFSPKMILGCAIIFIAIITAETKWQFIKPYSVENPVD
ncbi:DMT family transporter [Alkalibacter saccharofermentans]|uniref:Permease of the drug/metabolite transporter (DMT) superfamily n=1 Tax=Alkalibacter saccharofermentans DSM 14828 TaxID=1120975 RepID=A0A1M4XDP2_9FIRM|nr:DMT family transporter [Alkalibacter saccharofermentans]SHE91558.1 Permease of the drug/metabolite transporter (DMT) superfamily [Alkalibacter saccharofermentans DSM 14828]